MNTHWIVPRRHTFVSSPTSLRTPNLAPFDRLFRDACLGRSAAVSNAFSPVVDVVETDDAIRITAELPGLAREDFELSTDANVLTLKGVKKPAREPVESANDADDANESAAKESYKLAERRSGSFERRFRVAWEIDAESVAATFRGGVLEVVLSKPVEEQPQVRTIPVTSD